MKRAELYQLANDISEKVIEQSEEKSSKLLVQAVSEISPNASVAEIASTIAAAYSVISVSMSAEIAVRLIEELGIVPVDP